MRDSTKVYPYQKIGMMKHGYINIKSFKDLGKVMIGYIKVLLTSRNFFAGKEPTRE